MEFTRLDWLLYELRRLGLLGLAMPVLVALFFAGVAVLMVLAGVEEARITRVLTAGLELGLPIAVSFAAASVLADEPAFDLQLTVRTRYRTTVLRRLALLVGWTAVFAFLWASLLRISGLWAVPGSFLLGQLSWVAPLLWLVSAAALITLLYHSRTMSGALLGGLWAFENIFGVELFVPHDWLRPFFLFATTYTPGAEYWLGNRLALVATALVLLLCVVAVLRSSELLVNGGDA